MAVNPAAITVSYPAFCLGADENTTIDDAANELADEIVKFFQNATVTVSQAKISTGLNKETLAKAWKSDFKALEAKETTTVVANDFLKTATAITTGFTKDVVIATMPPVINPTAAALTLVGPVAPTTGYTITFGGDPSSLSQLIATAMTQTSPVLTASSLASAMTSLAGQVSGLYNGIYNMAVTPFSPAPGPPVPWFGIS